MTTDTPSDLVKQEYAYCADKRTLCKSLRSELDRIKQLEADQRRIALAVDEAWRKATYGRFLHGTAPVIDVDEIIGRKP